jgi:hypothetical protein
MPPLPVPGNFPRFPACYVMLGSLSPPTLLLAPLSC